MDHLVMYVGFSGQKMPEKVKEGDGFKTGDIVETIVDLREGKVEWRVNGAYQASTVNEDLRTQEAIIAPCLEMRNVGDIV